MVKPDIINKYQQWFRLGQLVVQNESCQQGLFYLSYALFERMKIKPFGYGFGYGGPATAGC